MHADMSIRIPDNRCLHGDTGEQRGYMRARGSEDTPCHTYHSLIDKYSDLGLYQCVCTDEEDMSVYLTHFNCPGTEQIINIINNCLQNGMLILHHSILSKPYYSSQTSMVQM